MGKCNKFFTWINLQHNLLVISSTPSSKKIAQNQATLSDQINLFSPFPFFLPLLSRVASLVLQNSVFCHVHVPMMQTMYSHMHFQINQTNNLSNFTYILVQNKTSLKNTTLS